MNKPDKHLTESIQAFLATNPAERNIRLGADLLLRLNRNRALHQSILRRPDKMATKLDYELKKHLRIRLDGFTLDQVARMERGLMPKVSAVLSEGDKTQTHGRRADHDTLPENIRAIYERGGEIFAKMRQIFETLKQMESKAPCDRYELLCILAELDTKYRQGWETYDTFDLATATPDPVSDENEDTTAMPTAKEVNAARRFVNRGREKAASLEGEERAALLQKMQQRIDLVLLSGGTFDPRQAEALRTLGLNL